jgi:Tfp pilus assembly protein PilV
MKVKKDQGITMLEVLVATILFAVFMAAVVAITELTGKLVKGAGTLSASELALARSIASTRLDKLARALSRESVVGFSEKVGRVNCLKTAKNWELSDNSVWSLSNQQLSNQAPDVELKGFIESICIYPSKYAENSTSDPPTPGLYVVQAEPKQTNTLLQPVRVLFCRPQNLCLQ